MVVLAHSSHLKKKMFLFVIVIKSLYKCRCEQNIDFALHLSD